MISIIAKISSCTSSKDVEAALELATLDVLQNASRDERSILKDMLATIEQKNEVTCLLDSAKLRRRTKRLIEMLDTKLETIAKPAPMPLRSSKSQISAPSSSSINKIPLSMSESIKALQNAQKPHDVEAVLNNLALPEKVDGQHSAEFLSNRDRLKAALSKLMIDSALTNNLLRKRIKKLAFALSSDEEKVAVKSTVKVISQGAARNTASKKRPLVPENIEKMHSKDFKDLLSTLSSLREASSIDEIDSALTGFNEFSVEQCKSQANYTELSALLANTLIRGDLNAKVRRKVKRCLEMMNSVIFGGAVVGSNSVAAPVSGAVTKRPKLIIPTPVLDATVSPKLKTTPMKTILSSVEAALGNASSVDLEASLLMVGTVDPADSVLAGTLVVLLKRILENGSEGININSALRRRITRSIDTLSSAVCATQSAPDRKPAETVVIHNPPPGTDLNPIILAAMAATDNASLCGALSGVAARDGNVTTRRKLVRYVTNLIKLRAIGSVTMSDSTISRCKAVMELLQPTANSGSKLLLKSEALKLGLIKEDNEAANKKNSEISAPKPIPYVIFFGQLAFTTRAKDIEELISTLGLEGTAKVRLLTEENGQAKGMAFVEINSAEDQHKCLSLHHSVLLGRKINVEKSCGGKNKEKRSEKLSLQRNQQKAKITEKIDLILEEYTDKGVLRKEDLGEYEKELFYSYIPAHVQKILQNVEKSLIRSGDSQAGFSQVIAVMEAFDRKLLNLSGKKRVLREVDEDTEPIVEEEDDN